MKSQKVSDAMDIKHAMVSNDMIITTRTEEGVGERAPMS